MESLHTIGSTELIEVRSRAIDLQKEGRSGRILSMNEIFKLIDVHEPYYALKDVTVGANDLVMAKVKIEQPLGDEVLPIGASEASRHLAILGSVCCALVNPVKQKHYYLAHRGTYKRAIEKTHFSGNELIVTAECVSFHKRTATIRACLLDQEEQLICGIDVSFHVIPHAIFERLYYNFYKEKPDFVLTNPYQHKSSFVDVQLMDLSTSASLGEVFDKNCAGHFPNYPAMPVAILLSSMLDLATLYIHHVTGDKTLKMMVTEFSLLAENLAFSGERVMLHVNREDHMDNKFKLRCVAESTDGKSVGDVTAIIEIV